MGNDQSQSEYLSEKHKIHHCHYYCHHFLKCLVKVVHIVVFDPGNEQVELVMQEKLDELAIRQTDDVILSSLKWVL